MKKVFFLLPLLLFSCTKPDTSNAFSALEAHRAEMNIEDGEYCVPCATASVSDYKPEGTQWVDLGLPSGKLWADRNIGANKPTEYGWLLALGESVPKSNYDVGTYFDYAGSCYYIEFGIVVFNMKKYNSCPMGKADDVCYKYLGGTAHTPTAEEYQELFNNTNVEFKTIGPVYLFNELIIPEATCLVFTSLDGKNQIVLPCAGQCVGKNYYPCSINPNFRNWGPHMVYWTNTTYIPGRSTPMSDQSYVITASVRDLEVFGKSGIAYPFPRDKFDGCSLRAVKSK